MKVHELNAILEDLEPDANVYVMSQRSWPFENAVSGVAVREDFTDCDDDDDGDASAGQGERHPRDRWSAPAAERPGSDVFILEGEQLRYGSKAAWDARR